MWACTCCSSQARVTSKKSLSSLSSRKATLMFVSKSFHRRQNFSLAISVTRYILLPCWPVSGKSNMATNLVSGFWEAAVRSGSRARSTKPLQQVVFGIAQNIQTFQESKYGMNISCHLFDCFFGRRCRPTAGLKLL